MTNIDRKSLMDIIPENLLRDEKVAAAAQAMDSELKLLLEEINRLSRYSRMDELTSEEVDELAWEFHVDFYDPVLPLEQRRELVENAITWHQRKGTPSAVEEIVATLFNGGKVKEWFEYGGKPYHFKIITREILTSDKRDKMMKMADSLKSSRSRLETIETIRNHNRIMNLSSTFATYSYNIPLTGTQVCGTYPETSTYGAWYPATIAVEYEVRGQAQQAFKRTGETLSGSDERFTNGQVQYEEQVSATAQSNHDRTLYPLAGDNTCGTIPTVATVGVQSSMQVKVEHQEHTHEVSYPLCGTIHMGEEVER